MQRLCTSIALVATLLTFGACSSAGGGDGGPGGGTGGGTSSGGGGGSGGRYTIYTLDSTNPLRSFIGVAFDPVTEKVGVAYYAATNKTVGKPDVDGGIINWDTTELRYVEWRNGQATAPQVIRETQVNIGLAAAFGPDGEPAVAFLGGGMDDTAGWPQSDAVVAFRSGGSTWTQRTAATGSADFTQPSCEQIDPGSGGISDRPLGVVVGLWPAMTFLGNEVVVSFRDVHQGQYPKQDWGASDFKVVKGSGTNWVRSCVVTGGNDKNAWGARTALAKAENGDIGFVFDQAFDGAASRGTGVQFLTRKANGTFTQRTSLYAVQNTGSGATIAWDSVLGWGVAVTDVSVGTPQLSYRRGAIDATTGAVTWASVRAVYQTGTGGWYPSLAFDPVNHEPAIAFYLCSARPGITDIFGCDESFDELRISQLFGNQMDWTSDTVDPAGAYFPKLGFFASGKRVVAYRDPRTFVVKLAVER